MNTPDPSLDTPTSRLFTMNATELGQTVFASLCLDLFIARCVVVGGQPQGELTVATAQTLVAENRHLLATLFDLSDRECEEIVSYTAIQSLLSEGSPVPRHITDSASAAAFFEGACDLSRTISFEGAVARLWAQSFARNGAEVLSLWDSEANQQVSIDGDLIAAALERTRDAAGNVDQLTIEYDTDSR